MRVRVRIVVTAYKPKPPRGDSVVSGVFIKPYHFLELSIIMKNTCSAKLNTKNCKVFVISWFFSPSFVLSYFMY